MLRGDISGYFTELCRSKGNKLQIRQKKINQIFTDLYADNSFLLESDKISEADLVARGFDKGQIRKYGFAFEGKEVLIG